MTPYPELVGCRDATVMPTEAHYDEALGEFVLPYHVVRTANDRPAVLLSFLQSTYEAAADRGGWDRTSLERKQPAWTRDGVALAGPLLRTLTGEAPQAPSGS